MKYLGLDVHSSATVWCLLGAQGEVLGQGKVATTAAELGRLVRELGPPEELLVGQEVGSMSYFVYDVLTAAGVKLLSFNAHQLRMIASSRKKTDKRDARTPPSARPNAAGGTHSPPSPLGYRRCSLEVTARERSCRLLPVSSPLFRARPPYRPPAGGGGGDAAPRRAGGGPVRPARLRATGLRPAGLRLSGLPARSDEQGVDRPRDGVPLWHGHGLGRGHGDLDRRRGRCRGSGDPVHPAASVRRGRARGRVPRR
ncbi:MAG: transposase [Deltaproteobacteria bacterium]|nr:transposase [Deltaproteobacteria bacterium]